LWTRTRQWEAVGTGWDQGEYLIWVPFLSLPRQMVLGKSFNSAMTSFSICKMVVKIKSTPLRWDNSCKSTRTIKYCANAYYFLLLFVTVIPFVKRCCQLPLTHDLWSGLWLSLTNRPEIRMQVRQKQYRKPKPQGVRVMGKAFSQSPRYSLTLLHISSDNLGFAKWDCRGRKQKEAWGSKHSGTAEKRWERNVISTLIQA
jgi:hypothetical protein